MASSSSSSSLLEALSAPAPPAPKVTAPVTASVSVPTDTDVDFESSQPTGVPKKARVDFVKASNLKRYQPLIEKYKTDKIIAADGKPDYRKFNNDHLLDLLCKRQRADAKYIMQYCGKKHMQRIFKFIGRSDLKSKNRKKVERRIDWFLHPSHEKEYLSQRELKRVEREEKLHPTMVEQPKRHKHKISKKTKKAPESSVPLPPVSEVK